MKHDKESYYIKYDTLELIRTKYFQNRQLVFSTWLSQRYRYSYTFPYRKIFGFQLTLDCTLLNFNIHMSSVKVFILLILKDDLN